ncbi:hypothetical protein [Mycolicibacter minnesotensis]
MTEAATAHCKKCSRTITECGDCDGTGEIGGDVCDLCLGERIGCPVHQTDWRSTKTHTR